MSLLGAQVLQTKLWLSLNWEPMFGVLGVCVQLPASAGAASTGALESVQELNNPFCIFILTFWYFPQPSTDN